ncbi:protein-glutamate methylesterase/protein-glutamine glutaminase [Desulfobaculum bizertense]|uniref:Protein-glutamate methylesterase/protein-glutamine glutaminase n=1 Tax=Desulfobaculum bizertense DSM 18034 TaxID=1121442 RepID=A0A1T4WWQ3_9BACT|nr:chemotaxis response regulator protein-glutamate methylesterase [Desulfobaculum bizertense]UIJ38583.1 chemotaxis response regulator protein-glutamate methylesterase [Desulfobaculum bizertense]SKA81577.1 two-component system, chemotaxis family, response regulator CheB [Desulfobaculum bizertense DSM 18034]
MGKIQVMLVDDSAVVRNTLTDILQQEPGIEVVASAADPFVAAGKMRDLVPDVIVLDIEMPRMDGVTFLRKIMSQHPIPVVICSSLALNGSETAMRCLEYGAVEIIQKPRVGTRQFLEESRIRIADAVRAASRANLTRLLGKPISVQPKLSADAVLSAPRKMTALQTTEKVVCVGASTGGTEALRVFLEGMPPDCPGIVIVQHMPEKFTAAFAQRLNMGCQITVKEAAPNDTVLRGQALIAPGNRHMLLKRSGARYYVDLKDGPLVSRHRPSVDVLYRSAARYAGPNVIGIIMTGMGDDGAKGMKEMKEAGAFNLAQDEASCVVFGMPQEAIKAGGVDKILGLERLASEACRLGR